LGADRTDLDPQPVGRHSYARSVFGANKEDRPTKIGALTVAKADLPFEEALDWFAEAGCEAVEIGTGNYPGDAHCDPYELNESESKRQAFMEAIESRGLELSALS